MSDLFRAGRPWESRVEVVVSCLDVDVGPPCECSSVDRGSREEERGGIEDDCESAAL